MQLSKYLTAFFLAIVILGALASPLSADTEVSSGSPVGSTAEYYERDPQLFKASDGTWFIIYARSQTIYSPGGNPDALAYDVYYSTSSDNGVTWTECDASKRMTLTGANFWPASITEADGNLWIIASDLITGDIYYQASADFGGAWSSPVKILTASQSIGAFHLDAVADGNDIWVFFAGWANTDGIYYIKYDGTTDLWSSPVQTLSGAYRMPRVIKDGPTYRMVSTVWSDIYYHTTSDPSTAAWTSSAIPGTTAPSGGASADPTLVKDSWGTTWVAYAPWFATDKQRVEYLTSNDDGANWSASTIFTAASFGSHYWWDYRPSLAMNGDTVLFAFASERNYPHTTRGVGEILLHSFPRNSLGWPHYEFIQTAIDAEPSNGTVFVRKGIYNEQIAINKPFHIHGFGNPAITAPIGALTSYSLQESSASFEPIIFAYGGTIDGSNVVSGSGTIDVHISGFDIDGNNAGTVNRFAGIMLRNCLNSTVELNNIYEMLYSSGMPQTSGILIYGNSYVAVSQNIINDWSRGGIIANGDDGTLPDPQALVELNTVVGEGVLPLGYWAQNGIQIGFGAGGRIMGNNVSDIAILDPDWSASGLVLYYPAAGVLVQDNNVHDCQAGLNAYFAEGFSLTGNTFSQNDFEFIWGGNGISVSDNIFTADEQALYISDATAMTVNDNDFTGNSYGIIMDGTCDNIQCLRNSIVGSTTTGIAVAPYLGNSPANIAFHANDISGNTFGLENTTPNLIDGSGNWWGDASGPSVVTLKNGNEPRRRPALIDLYDRAIPDEQGSFIASEEFTGTEAAASSFGSGDQVTALVDYSPWWSANYMGDLHASPWKWFLDDIYSSSLQEAADLMLDGDSVVVLNGLYNWVLNLENRNNLTFLGENRLNTILQFDGTLSWNVGTYGITRQTAIRVVNSTGIIFDSLTMDFNLIKGNNISGVLYWNSGGTIANSLLENMNLPDANGGYYELMCYMRAPNNSDVNRAQVNFLNNDFIRTGRVGIIAHDYVNVLIEGNNFDKVDDDFGYAMEIGSMSTGIIRGNSFINYDTWALSDQSASGAIYVENSFTSGVGPVAKPVVIENNDISFCQFGIHVGNEFAGYAGDVDIQINMTNNTIRDCQTSGSESSGGIKIADEGRNLGSSVTIVMDNNRIQSNSDYGVYIYTTGNGAIDATLTNNIIFGHYQGAIVKNFGSSTGSLYNLSVHHNLFQNNLNAENDAAAGYWDDGISVGNCWSDFNLNPGYPTQYNVPGVVASVDRYPNVDCSSLCNCRPGEANNNGNYNILDITYLINNLYKSGPNPAPYDVCSGDANCNCSVNILDVTYLLNYLYKMGAAPCQCYQWAALCGLPLYSGVAGDDATTVAKAIAGTQTKPLTAYR